MARVKSAVARQDYPEQGIKKGQKYYYWSFVRQPRQMSATYPRPSQLCNNKFSGALAAMETLSDEVDKATSIEDITSAIEDAKSSLEEVKSEYEDALSSLEQAFQGGSPQIDEHQEKVSNLESCIDELDGAATEVSTLDASDYANGEYKKDPEGFDDLNEEDQGEMLQAAKDLASEVSLEG